MPPRNRATAENNWPTPEEIAERTAAIRSSWSKHQHRVRAGLSPELNAVEIAVVAPGALDGRTRSIHFD